MRNTAHHKMVRGFRRMVDMERKKTVRNAISRGRHLDRLDWTQLPPKSNHSIVDVDGVFFFIPGVSVVGGGDKVRP